MTSQFTQELKNYVGDAMNKMHTCLPGKIQSFDSSKCIATVSLTAKYKKPSGEYMDFPETTEVPIVLLQSSGQDATIASPIKEGDGCLVFFSEQQLDHWRNGRDPESDLKHDITSAIAVVGMFVDSNDVVKEACDENAIIIDKENTRMIIKKQDIEIKVDKDSEDAVIKLTPDTISLKRGGSKLTLEDTTITADAATFKINGKLEVSETIEATGNISSNADVKSATASLSTHVHNCTAPGAPSGLPISAP